MPKFLARFAAAALFCAALAAQPQLTTIQDVLYKADGTRFNGTMAIGWKSFEAADTSNITTHSLTVRIKDGSLRVQLVPTTNVTPAVYYAVKYNSDGKVQFEETWAVPPSALPLRVRDVRVAAAPIVEPGAAPLEEQDVVGLSADLAARPLKGPAYAPDRIAFINASGVLEGVQGSPQDCIRVDGSAGPCGTGSGGAPIVYVDVEAPQGAIDGANAVFTLAGDPDPASSLTVYRNGLLQTPGLDYQAMSRTVTFLAGAVPQPGDVLAASYRQQAEPGGPPAVPGPQVLCSAAGFSTSSTALSNVGTCNVAANVLRAGDRVEILFDYAQDSGVTGFEFQVKWGATAVLDRSTAAGETMATGRIEASISATGALVSAQSWGGTLPLASSITNVPDAGAGGLTLNFAGRLIQAGAGSMSLRNLTVVRYPGH